MWIWPDASFSFRPKARDHPRKSGGWFIHWKCSRIVAFMLFFLNTHTHTYTHLSFRGRMGRSDVAGETLVFLEMLSPTSLLAVGSEAAGDFPAQGSGWAAMGIGGSIPGSDVLFLTLEPSSPGVRALTCLSSGCKGHPLSSSHAVHAAFSVGVYINVLALIYIPKKFQGTISICIQIHI